MNLVCRDDALRQQLISKIQGVFPSVLMQEIPEEVNCVLHCTRGRKGDLEALKRKFEVNVCDFSKSFEGRNEDVVESLSEMVKNVSVL